MKKQLRVVLFAVLVLLLVTVTAIAASAATPFSTGGNSYSTLEQAVAAVSANGIITVTENVSLSANATLSRATTYTLKGSKGTETITFTGGGLVIGAGNVTIENLTITANAANAITVQNSATELTVSTGAVIVSNGTTDTTGLSVAVAGGATLLIEDGTLTGAVGAAGTTTAAGADITIEGGTLNSNTKTPAGHVLRITQADFNLTVTGGTFNFTSTSDSLSSLLYSDHSSVNVTISGGTFNANGTNPAPLLYFKHGTYTISGGKFRNYLSSTSTDNSTVLLLDASTTTTSDCTISGGNFYSAGGAYTYAVKVFDCTSFTISGGFFTFVDTLASADDINTEKATAYKNSHGNNSGYGVTVKTSAPVRITGGTFMCGSGYSAFNIGECAPNVVISGGTFYGFRAVKTNATGGTLNIVGGSFYSNPGQANCKLLDVQSAKAVVNVYGGTFDANHNAASNVSTGGVIYFEKAGTVNVYGGTFNCSSDSVVSSLVRLDTAGSITFDSTTVTIDGTVYQTSGANLSVSTLTALVRVAAKGATVQINKGTFAAAGEASVIVTDANGTVTINGGTFTTTEEAAAIKIVSGGTVTVNDGTFTAAGEATVVNTVKCSAATLNGGAVTVNSGTVTVNGGTYTAGNTATVMYLVGGNVVINGGTFTGTGACLFDMVQEKGFATFEVKGGTFTLAASNVIGGAIIRTGVGVTPEDAGQYYDPTKIYCFSSADIVLSGGLFIDDRTGNNQIIDATLGSSRVVINGAILLSHQLQTHFVDGNGRDCADVAMTAVSPTCIYNTKTYYCYTASNANQEAMAPVIESDAEVALTETKRGIRFTSYIPAEVVAKLPAGYTFGTLIAPADYVAAAGGFTHAKLNAWQAANPSVGVAYVDIAAKNSISNHTDGSIFFNGALVSLNPNNYTRSMAAIAYIKANDVYYYSSYDPVDNARTMAQVAKQAYTDVVDLPDEEHLNDSLYKRGAHSAYTVAEQEILKTYSAYTHTWDSATVTPSTLVNYPESASANLQAQADALSTTLSGRGYGTAGATILVGNTGDTEVATALSEIEGHGYYVGVINGKIVIVGTTNALTMQALAYFEEVCLAKALDGKSFEIWEKVNSNAEMIPLTAETPFVFPHTRDGNMIDPHGSAGSANEKISFISSSKTHLYNYELNNEYVDYPIVAAIEISAALGSPAEHYNYVPDKGSFKDHGIYVGVTDMALSTLLPGNDVGYYGYAIENGNVIISSFDDATLRLAKKLFIEDLPDFAADGVYLIPADYSFEKGYSDGFTGAFYSYSTNSTIQAGAKYVAKELALLPTNFPRPADLALSGAVNVDSNSLELYYQNATVENYEAYCALLEQKGYTEYMAEREAEGSYFVTYYNRMTKLTLHVIYSKYQHAQTETLYTGTALSEMFPPTLRVIAAKVDGSHINLLPEKYLTIPATGKLTNTKLTVVQTPEANVGFCYLYTLEDGTFVVLDGGSNKGGADYQNLYNVMTELHTQIHGKAPSATNPIVVSAWYISHGHGDHYPMMSSFISNYCSASTSRVRVDAIVGNFASNDEIYNSDDPNQTLANRIGTNDWLKNNGVPIPYYKVHTGQRFFIGNLEFEVMYTHEDIHPWPMLYYNNTSTVIRLTAHNTDGNGNILPDSASISNMALGDLQARGSMVMRAMWGDALKSDIVVTAHHGGGGIESECYELIDAQIILWSHVAESVEDYAGHPSPNSKIDTVNKKWLSNTHWYYIFSMCAYENTLGSNEFYNLTMTITKHGIVGLYEGGDTEFIGALTNVAGGSADTTLSFGTGKFGEKDTYVGDGYIFHRDNFNYQIPTLPKPGDMDCAFDSFGIITDVLF